MKQDLQIHDWDDKDEEEKKQLLQERFDQLKDGYDDLNGWTLGFNENKRRVGVCKHQHDRIEINEHLLRNSDWEQALDTLRHEAAHALTPGESHGAEWKMKARELGAKPKRCASLRKGVLPRVSYVLT